MKPQDILSENVNHLQEVDGVRPRKGSIYATMLNAKHFDELLVMQAPDVQEFTTLLEDIRELIPTLHTIGLFEFFSPLEWLQNPDKKEGRALVATLYLQAYPEAVTEAIQECLTNLNTWASTQLKEQIALIKA